MRVSSLFRWAAMCSAAMFPVSLSATVLIADPTMAPADYSGFGLAAGGTSANPYVHRAAPLYSTGVIGNSQHFQKTLMWQPSTQGPITSVEFQIDTQLYNFPSSSNLTVSFGVFQQFSGGFWQTTPFTVTPTGQWTTCR